ncbi:protein-tyrosine-phosphatase [Bifidobacterium lemurum]|uniref:Protein-tyrosine-phosphatase n=1 Tax=Bifidobacterium lemurum TaxID=1603886 RepID=A0A261FQ82_9BIFI|nr:hypothetical protein [Bifidobacterium lemurum]OZG61314.1 protein-tyrosine-phosphatase [Bifidobacterium lemurum]QOL34702.1 low molecular weight phosphatase family protein [Bifidobacterium lemurum]
MHVLFVCRGNICRSALSEYLFRDSCGQFASVSSAGLLHLAPSPMDPHYLRLLTYRGIDASAHRSTPFAPDMANQADVILVFTDSQLGKLLEWSPSAAHKTFLLDDFANLADACVRDGDLESAIPSTPENRLATIIANAPFKRPTLPRPQDIPDPFGHSADSYRTCAEHIIRAVDVIAQALTPSDDPSNSLTRSDDSRHSASSEQTIPHSDSLAATNLLGMTSIPPKTTTASTVDTPFGAFPSF